MARSPTLESTLARLSEIRRFPTEDEALLELRRVIGGKQSAAVAMAAEIGGEAQLTALVPDLAAAFDRFMENPVKCDPGCRAKAAIAEALHQLDACEGELYLRGVRHVQMEPVWGGREDSAADLRGASARGLVRMRHPDTLIELGDLLADPKLPARLAATRAIAYHGSEFGLPLLRLKVLMGDDENEVVGECMLALMRLSPESSLPFVTRFLDDDDAILAEAAALSLGESRAPGALHALSSWRSRSQDPHLACTALLAIAMLRSDDAIEYLLELVSSEPGPAAREAIGAFELYRGDAAMAERVREVVLAREDVDLEAAVAEVFA